MMWNYLGQVVIPTMCDPHADLNIGRHGCVHIGYQKITLPSGRELQYPDLHAYTTEDARGFSTEYRYDDGTRDRYKKVIYKKLYGGLLLENIIQALARDVLAWQQVRIERSLQEQELGWVIGSVHDEILANLVSNRAEEGFNLMQKTMSKGPDWCYDLPLDNEGGFAAEYSK